MFPEDFGFILKTDTDEINSIDATYRRRYLNKDTIVVLKFTKAELTNIYSLFLEHGLNNFPTNYEPAFQTASAPVFYYEYLFRINGQYKSIKFTSNCFRATFHWWAKYKLKQLQKVAGQIEQMTFNKKEIQGLQETDIGFF